MDGVFLDAAEQLYATGTVDPVWEDDPPVYLSSKDLVNALNWGLVYMNEMAGASGIPGDLDRDGRLTAVDLAILDMNMPGLTGADTLPRLRELRPGLAVMVATGFADEETQDLITRYPRVRIIEKPYELAEIQRRMAELIAEGPA